MKKSTIKKLQKGSEAWFIGAVARFGYIFGVLALIYGFFVAPIFMAANYVIMAILLIAVGVYLGKIYKKKSKKSLWW